MAIGESPSRIARAARYDIGDVLRYSRASKETGIAKGSYAPVKSIDTATNRLTVEMQDGTERTYDPRRQRGVSVFREEIRSVSVGDRIQFTVPANELKIAYRELGTIEAIDGVVPRAVDGGRLAILIGTLCHSAPDGTRDQLFYLER
jgi:hypothetical protein